MAYSFHEDWFSQNLDAFRHFLLPFRARECRLLEIGSHEGRSAVWLLDNIVHHEKSSLVSIDVEDKPNLRPNLEATGKMSQVDLRIGYSRDVLKTLTPSSFDFIYIDGSHAQVEVLEDAVLSFRLAKVGAIIAFDDYLWNEAPLNKDGIPKTAIDAFGRIYAKKIRKIGQGWSIWFHKLAD